MQELELNSVRLLRLWWAFTWRFIGLSVALWGGTVLVCAVAVFLYTKFGVHEEHAKRVFFRLILVAWAIETPMAGLAAIRLTLGKPLGRFRLALLACEPKKARPEPDASPAEVIAAR